MIFEQTILTLNIKKTQDSKNISIQ
jgi:hypothetical protein